MSDKITLALSCIPSNFITHVVVDESRCDVIYIMEKHGRAFCQISWFHNDNDRIYLDLISVDDNIRKLGTGSHFLQLYEEIAFKIGITILCLLVKKNSWMHDWYKRKGYNDFEELDEEEGNIAWIWMRKVIKI